MPSEARALLPSELHERAVSVNAGCPLTAASALIREDGGVAAQALKSLGITEQTARPQLADIIDPGQQAPSGHIPFTPRAKKILQLSLREAIALALRLAIGHPPRAASSSSTASTPSSPSTRTCQRP